MLRYQTWIARRLFAEREMHGIDPSVLRRTLDFVVERNQENRLRFSLLTDLTTFVQLGDLVEIDFNPGKGASWKVIELKEGKVNDLISEFLEERKLKLTSSDLQEISEMPGKDLNKQASRMLRQRKELIEFNKILATDRGIDLGTKEEVVLTKEVVTTESYIEEIGRVCVKALESGVASAIVDGCLRIVAAKGEISKKGPGAIAHVFYHMAKPGTDCRLKDGPDSVREELRAMKEMPSYIDLVQQNLHSYWGQPLFLWFHPNMVLDLLFGRVRVFAQFDLAHFFELAKTKGIKMSWITKRNAQESGDYGRLIPGSPGAYAILAVLPNGNKQTLLLGFISRVSGDVVRPKTLLDLILRDPTEFREKISLKPD